MTIPLMISSVEWVINITVVGTARISYGKRKQMSNIYKELENRSKKETPKVALKVTDVPPVTPSEEVKENETPNK